MKTKLKIMSTLLATVLALSTFITNTVTASAAENTKIVLGDVNNDDVIDIEDVTEIQRYIVDEIQLTDNQRKAANICEDNRLDITDVTDLQRYVAGYEGVNENINKTWRDSVTESVWVFDSEPKLRYIYTSADVCNTCKRPFINGYSHSEHHTETKHSGYHNQYDWYYVDENGQYHDLDNDGKVPDQYNDREYEVNVFDVGFDPYLWEWSIDEYNDTHSDKLYYSKEIYARCNDCNSDGTSIFDEYGGIGNMTGSCLKLTEPIEYIEAPASIADMDGYFAKMDEISDKIDAHQAYHKEKGDIPSYLSEADTRITTIPKIYSVDSLSGHYEDKVINKGGWY